MGQAFLLWVGTQAHRNSSRDTGKESSLATVRDARGPPVWRAPAHRRPGLPAGPRVKGPGDCVSGAAHGGGLWGRLLGEKCRPSQASQWTAAILAGRRSLWLGRVDCAGSADSAEDTGCEPRARSRQAC